MIAFRRLLLIAFISLLSIHTPAIHLSPYALVVNDDTNTPSIGAINLSNVTQVTQVSVFDQGLSSDGRWNPKSNVTFSADGLSIAVGFSGQIQTYNLENHTQLVNLGSPEENMSSVAFSPTANLLLAVASDNPMTCAIGLGKVYVWNLETQGDQESLLLDAPYTLSAALSPNGSVLVAADLSGNLWTWYWESQTATFRRTESLPLERSNDCSAVTFNNTGELFACGQFDGQVTIYNWRTNHFLETAMNMGGEEIREVLFSPDGSRLVTNHDLGGEVSMLDIVTGETRQLIESDPWYNSQIAFSPDGSVLVITTGREPGKGDSILPNARIELRNGFTGDLITTIEDQYYLTDVAFNPTGTMFATSSIDGSVRMWGIPTPQNAPMIMSSQAH